MEDTAQRNLTTFAGVVLLAVLAHNVRTFLDMDMDWGTVLAACIGVAGYVVDARTSRASEIRALRVERARAQFAELLVPINVHFHSLLFSLYAFLDRHFDVAFPGADRAYTNEDGVVRRRCTQWVWQDADGLMHVTLDHRPAGVPHEIPETLETAIRKDPELAAEYRAWIVNEWLPSVERVEQRIDDAAHLMETIPTSQLATIFGPSPPMGGTSWEYTPRGMWFSWWAAYARAWRAVVNEWDAHDYSRIRPSVAFPVGIYFYVVQGQTVVGELQRRLTGHSQMHGSHGTNFHT